MPLELDIFIVAEKLKENPTSSSEVFQILKLIRPNWQRENIRAKVGRNLKNFCVITLIGLILYSRVANIRVNCMYQFLVPGSDGGPDITDQRAVNLSPVDL